MVELFDTYGVLHIGLSSFLFDLDDLPIIESRSWYVDKDGYLTSSYYYLGMLRIIRFHRIVAHPQPGQRVDHKNKNRADNRKQNLRCCSALENNWNKSLYATNTSGVTGVSFDKQRKRWVASITHNGKGYSLVVFMTKKMQLRPASMLRFICLESSHLNGKKKSHLNT